MNKLLLLKIDRLNYKLLVYIICMFNILDLVCTYIGLKKGYIKEGNAMMAYFYDVNSFYFLLVKSAAIIFFFLILVKYINKISYYIKMMILVTFSIYFLVSFYHLYIIDYVIKNGFV